MWTPPTFSQGCGPVPVHRANVYGVISQSRTSLMLKHDCTTWGAGWSGESLEGIIEGELSHWRHSMVSCSEVHASCNSCIINGALAVTLRMCLLLQLFSIVPLQPWYPCRAPPPKLLCSWVAVVKLTKQLKLYIFTLNVTDSYKCSTIYCTVSIQSFFKLLWYWPCS